MSDRFAVIQDNNFPGKWLWMSPGDFLTRWKGTGGGWAIRDLASTNGLRVNGQRVGTEAVPVRPGDALEIGTVSAQFEAG